ncbi:MAG: helix-turn-helix domain-containing protein, partial [Anaerolineae bacterium]|nr:helix-turn-helix domain-containing protein [Anaerolineae bacterium]
MANWLLAHPGVEIISRDRAGEYAAGARLGAPQAVQVADRFHLLLNAGNALDGMLRNRRLQIEETSEQMEGSTAVNRQEEVEPPAADLAPVPVRLLSPTQQQQAERRAARTARWEKVKALREAGASISAIARESGMNRRTVRNLLSAPSPPRNKVQRPRPGGLRSPLLQPYVSYLQDRWQAGCTNVSQLLREIVARGFPGSRSLLAQAVAEWRPKRPPPEVARRE